MAIIKHNYNLRSRKSHMETKNKPTAIVHAKKYNLRSNNKMKEAPHASNVDVKKMIYENEKTKPTIQYLENRLFRLKYYNPNIPAYHHRMIIMITEIYKKVNEDFSILKNYSYIYNFSRELYRKANEFASEIEQALEKKGDTEKLQKLITMYGTQDIKNLHTELIKYKNIFHEYRHIRFEN